MLRNAQEKLADYTLFERIADLTAEMVRAGCSLESAVGGEAPVLVFSFEGMAVNVRIMCNQWDVLMQGPNRTEEGHARGPAADVARWVTG